MPTLQARPPVLSSKRPKWNSKAPELVPGISYFTRTIRLYCTIQCQHTNAPPCVRTDTTISLTLPYTTMLGCSNAIYPSRNTHRRPRLAPILKKTLMRSQLCRGRASVFLRRRFYSPNPVATTPKAPGRFVPTIFSHHFVSPIRCRGASATKNTR